jgi:putative ABC transport system permease protein
MLFVEAVKLAWQSIRTQKLRSALTVVGMNAAVAAVIIVVSMIQGFKVFVDGKIAQIGSRSFMVRRFSTEDFGTTDTIAAAQRRNKELTLEDFDYLQSRSTLVDKWGAQAAAARVEVRSGMRGVQDVRVNGVTPSVAEIDDTEMAEGRFFVDAENRAASEVAVIGAKVETELFPLGWSDDQQICIGGIPYRVIGMAASKGAVFGVSQDVFVTLPLKTYGKNFGGLSTPRSLSFVATAKSDDEFDSAVDEARRLMRQRRHLGGTQKDNFGIITPDGITGLRDRLFAPIFVAAIAVPLVAVVVGGVVIMNIMLVSVTERSKEIGIRKAVGARRLDILCQYLAEAIALSIGGGIAGVFLAWLAAGIISVVFFPTQLSTFSILGAVAVSGLIGILFGLLPAWRAARLNPIEVLRST